MSGNILLCCAVLTLGAVLPLAAQTNASHEKAPAFEVASIRPSKSNESMHAGATADGYQTNGLPLLVPILVAYVPSDGGDAAFFGNDRVLGVPDWLRSEQYDVTAKVAETDMVEWQKPAAQKVMLRAMLQSLLTERCRLAVHRETREVPVYALVVGKGGPKFSEAKPDEPHPAGLSLPDGTVVVASNGGQTLKFYDASMGSLAQVLANFAGRPVQDKTGLTGRYDFTFERGVPTEQSAGEAGGPATSVFTSVQESLGLRLDAAKGSVETLVIDHVERPSQN